ncbi:MAG: glycosyltransferase family 4 protein [Bacteroidia bacterium]|nr:glycosyltransferase family 4 protein [Bacteroidia bacterium]
MSWKNQHIVIVGPAHPLRGGLATYNERLATELKKHNKVSILTFTLQYPNFLFPGESQYTHSPKPEYLDIDVALNSVNPFNWIKVGLKYKKLRPDVIIFRFWMPFFGPAFGLLGRIVKSNKHTRLIAITDNIIPHETRFFDRPFTSYFLGMLDGAVSMSREVLQDLKSHFPKTKVSQNSQYNPHPLYDNFGKKLQRKEACVTLGLNPDRKYILFFGFIRKYKGLDWLIEAFLQAADQLENVDLLIAGEFYEDAAPYHAINENSTLKDRIHWHTHFIPNERVSAYFSVADLVAQSYKSATQSGVSQVAYHFDVPMLITNVGGLSELVPHDVAGWVSEPNIKSITRGLVEVFKADRLTRYQKNLPDIKSEFSWEKMVEALDL